MAACCLVMWLALRRQIVTIPGTSAAHDDSLKENIHRPDLPNTEPGRRIELLSPDYKAGALPLSYPGQLDLCGGTDNSMPEAGDRRHGIGECRTDHADPARPPREDP